MTKEEALEEFFRGLKVAFSISGLYNQEHPYFVKSVEEFRIVVNRALDVLITLKIGVTPDTLVVDEKVYSGNALYKELARMLHVRRIKTITIKKGITLEELIFFLSKLSMSQKKIMNKGVSAELDKEKLRNVAIEELDYSQLLKEEGGEYKDIWTYLLNDAAESGIDEKVDKLVDNFGALSKNFTLKELTENEETAESLHKFLGYLQKKDKGKFLKCSKEVAKIIFDSRNVDGSAETVKIKRFFENLSEEELAEMLSDQILNNKNFNSLSFNLFSKITENHDHEKLSSLVSSNLKSNHSQDTRKIKAKIGSMFSLSGDIDTHEFYHKALADLFNDDAADNTLSFDWVALEYNYQMTLLNLLSFEENKEKVNVVAERLSMVLKDVISKKDFNSLKLIVDTIRNKSISAAGFNAELSGLSKLITQYVEENIWEESASSLPDGIMDFLQTSAYTHEFYINKIFNENRLNSKSIKLFFKFFPDKINVFYEQIKVKAADLAFIEGVVLSLKAVDLPLSLEVLKYIYKSCNILIKLEVLRSMGDFSQQDKSFLKGIIKTDNMLLRKEALWLLIEKEENKKEILDMFFSGFPVWGFGNKWLFENMAIVGELRLREARPHLERFSKFPFFWNRRVRKKACEIIRNWNG